MSPASIFALLAILLSGAEILIALQAVAHRRWIFPKRIRPRLDAAWLPRAAIVVPTKGAAPQLARHLGALLALDYPDYEVIFVVEDEADAGVPVIRDLIARDPHRRAQLVIAGLAARCSQQNFNMVAGAAAAGGAEVLAFCDNDIAPDPRWLRNLVKALTYPGVAVATGYRWLVPERGTLGEHAHVFANMTFLAHFTLIAQLSRRGVWGGSFALRRIDYEAWEVAARWSETLFDDMTLNGLVAAHDRRTLLTADVLVHTEDVLPGIGLASRWYTRQLLNVKAVERATWAFGAGIPLALAGFFLGLLPAAILAALTGHSFWAWGGKAALIFWMGEIVLAAVCGLLGPTRRHASLMLRMPLLRATQVVAFLRTIGSCSVEWAGVSYRFGRKGRVVEVRRLVPVAECAPAGRSQVA